MYTAYLAKKKLKNTPPKNKTKLKMKEKNTHTHILVHVLQLRSLPIWCFFMFKSMLFSLKFEDLYVNNDIEVKYLYIAFFS